VKLLFGVIGIPSATAAVSTVRAQCLTRRHLSKCPGDWTASGGRCGYLKPRALSPQRSFQAAEHIGPTRERKTERQKNLHPPQSLAWLAGIIARLAGWNCYYAKPGRKTIDWQLEFACIP
jgi:hypothetical protein